MTTLSELVGRPIIPEANERNRPKVELLPVAAEGKSEKRHAKCEAEVFKFLWVNKEELGIKSVMKFTALLVDGAVELTDGKRLTVEIKLRMNWAKACQAEWQFRTFLKRKDRMPFPVDGGIVLFDEFSGDWNSKANCRLLENGWSNWYQGHSEVDPYRVDLFRLRAEKLEAYAIANVLTQKVHSPTSEDPNRRFGV